MSNLKTCPFCGCDVYISHDINGDVYYIDHTCNDDEIERNVVVEYCDTKKQAAESWNTRTEQTCTAVRHKKLVPTSTTTAKTVISYSCSKCGNIIDNSDNYCRSCGARLVE